MDNITPKKIEYNLQIKDHTMRATVIHNTDSRKISFFFDEKVVSEKTLSQGDFMTDDDCISELVRNYCNSNTGVYADLFKRHSDKVHLAYKTLEFVIENYGIEMHVLVTVEKEKYYVEAKANNGEDVFSGTFRSLNFSEVLEKVRMFTTTLVEISDRFSSHINELSNDKVEEWITWQ